MNNYYKCGCGRYFSATVNGGASYLGREWGEMIDPETHEHYDTNRETTRCPFDGVYCKYHEDFKKYWRVGDCEGQKVKEEEFDYNNSIDKIRDDLEKESHSKVMVKFGAYCQAINDDGRGGYKVEYCSDNCRNCWNAICNITNKKRDTSKAYCVVAFKTTYEDNVGLYSKTVTKVVHKRANKEPMPYEVCVRALKEYKKGEYNLIGTCISNNTERITQELRLKPTTTVEKVYIEKSNAKRDFLEDLQAVANGIEVIHERDIIKAEKEEKNQERAIKKREKEKRIKTNIRIYKEKEKYIQENLFKEIT